jgi:transcription elongation factor Elf1
MAETRGFGKLPCPKCGAETSVCLDLDDMESDEAFTCCECEENFGMADVKAFLQKWAPVFEWIDKALVVTE